MEERRRQRAAAAARPRFQMESGPRRPRSRGAAAAPASPFATDGRPRSAATTPAPAARGKKYKKCHGDGPWSTCGSGRTLPEDATARRRRSAHLMHPTLGSSLVRLAPHLRRRPDPPRTLRRSTPTRSTCAPSCAAASRSTSRSSRPRWTRSPSRAWPSPWRRRAASASSTRTSAIDRAGDRGRQGQAQRGRDDRRPDHHAPRAAHPRRARGDGALQDLGRAGHRRAKGHLVGILTNRDLRFETRPRAAASTS